jgi:alkylation response protein AidB-like acyl-CoA dehydrogenase
VFSAMIPAQYGGGDASHSQMCDFIRTVAHSCPSTALALSMHQHLIAAAVFNDAAGRPGAKMLEKVASGNIVLVSTGANDWLESNGTATKVDGGFNITAVKPFASGSPDGQMILTSCAYDDPDDGPQVLHFPVPLSADGITFMDNWKTHGMCATGSQTLKLDAVFVADEAIALRRPRGGFHPAFAIILGVALPLIMSAYTGVAEGAAKIAREKAAGRQGDPVAPYLVGEMENLLTATQIAQEDMVRLSNNLDFEPSVHQASQMLIRKTICATNALKTCEKAMEVVGGASFFRELGLERRLRDVRASHFHPLPEKRQQLFTGRLSMGLEAVG